MFGDTPIRAAARDISLVALPLTAFLALLLARCRRLAGWQRMRWAFGAQPGQAGAPRLDHETRETGQDPVSGRAADHEDGAGAVASESGEHLSRPVRPLAIRAPAPFAPSTCCPHTSAGAGALLAALGLLLAAKALWIGPHTSWFRLASPAGLALPAQHASGGAIVGQVVLLGYDLDQYRVTQGSELHVTLYWQALRPLARELLIVCAPGRWAWRRELRRLGSPTSG